MPSNIELKMVLKDVAPLREAARRLSGLEKPTGLMKQEDVFFCGAKGRLKMRVENDQVSGSLIQYERQDKENAKFSDYVKVDVPNAADMQEALRRAYGVQGVVKKQRELWIIGQTRIHIDQVEGLGSFVEFEVMMKPDQSIDEGEMIAGDLLKKLGLTEAKKISGAYMDLILAKES